MSPFQIKLLEFISIIVFIGMILVLFFIENTTSLVWTVIVPIVPLLFLLLGYYNWRKICPLAYFSKVSQKLSWIQKRKVPTWFEDNFYLFQYILLFTAFSFRLTILNFDSFYLGIFFVFVILSAFVTNLIFTGKSWCNFFCPVGVVEKIYCNSNAHNYHNNSACSSCSACKKNCPDIDMESNYWKENTNTQKTFVIYSFSGLILGFYLYFYLQSGSWASYFSGNWANEYLSMTSNGFFFAPFIPLFIAVPITLALFSLSSYYLFKNIEKYVWKFYYKEHISYSAWLHRMKVLSSFTAFNTFYVFAGAPSYMQYPILYALFYFVVVVTSSMFFYKEIFREESFFIQERFALKMIKKWTSSQAIPKNLKEIYYTYVNATKDKKEKLQTYRESIVDLLNEGVLNTESMVVLEKLREQMAISEKDHLLILKGIKLNNQDLFDANIEQSSERRYQKASYTKVLEEALTKHEALNASYIDTLRKQFCISDLQHKEIIDSILNANEKLKSDVISLLKQMNALRRVHKSILDDKSHEITFLKYVIRNEFNNISKELFNLLNVIYKDYTEDITILKRIFKYRKIGTKIDLQRDSLHFMDDKIANAIFELKKDFDNIKHIKNTTDNYTVIKYLMSLEIPSISIGALLVAINYDVNYLDEVNINKFLYSPDMDTRALVKKILSKSTEVTLYEQMMHLHNIHLFQNVRFYDLKLLAQSTEVVSFQKNTKIITQGEEGNTLYIIISGSVETDVDGIIVDRTGDRTYFGEIALLGDITRTASVKAVSEVSALTLSKDALKEFMKENSEISAKLMKNIIRRLLENKACKLGENSEE